MKTFSLQWATKTHNEEVLTIENVANKQAAIEYARAKGYALNEYGLLPCPHGDFILCEVFSALG